METNWEEINNLVEEKISAFKIRRCELMGNITLSDLLQKNESFLLRSNKYLIKYMHSLDFYVWEIIRLLIYERFSWQEVKLYEEFLKELAISVCRFVYNGKQSLLNGIDLEFEKGGKIYLVVIRPDAKWWFSFDDVKIERDFREARNEGIKRYRKSQIACISGFCFGKFRQSQVNGYRIISGKAFWTLISGRKDLFPTIIAPIEKRAREEDDQFYDACLQARNKCTYEFIQKFYRKRAGFDWEKVMNLNAARVQ